MCENCLQAELKQQGETEEAAGTGIRKTCVHMLLSNRKEEMKREGIGTGEEDRSVFIC